MEAKASNGSIIRTGDMVLVRDYDDGDWYISIFGNKTNKYYACANGIMVNQCIPLNGNEHLCGTNDKYEEPYIPKFGDKVEGINKDNEKVIGILTFYNKEYKNYKYVIHTSKSTSKGFNSSTYVCKSIKPIRE